MAGIINMASRGLERDVYLAHKAWLDGGGKGRGRLVARGELLSGLVAAALDLRLVRFDDCRLVGANFGHATLSGAELVGSDLATADLYMAALRKARIRRCRFGGARLALACFEGATLADCELDGVHAARVDLSKTSISGCRLAGATLRDLTLDDATVSATSFVGAVMARTQRSPVLGRVHGSTFEHCDFRGVDFSGLQIADCSFVACRFHAATGVPALGDRVVVRDADLSVCGDGSELSGGEAFLERWKSDSLGGGR